MILELFACKSNHFIYKYIYIYIYIYIYNDFICKRRVCRKLFFNEVIAHLFAHS